LVEDASDFSSVDVEFAGDGALTLACLVPGTDGLLQGWRSRQFPWRILLQRRCGLVQRLRLGLSYPVAAPGTDEHHQQFDEPTSATAGLALTGPWPTPWAMLAPTVATMPVPSLQAASRGTRWRRRLASSTTMEAAQISPSTVNGSSRAVRPDSPCERTNHTRADTR
jgi:hypothetical protein